MANVNSRSLKEQKTSQTGTKCAMKKDYPLWSQEHAKDLLMVQSFLILGVADWYMLEYDPVEKIGFGYVQGLAEDELGYISLTELESIKDPLGIGIKQDIYFVQKRLSEVK